MDSLEEIERILGAKDLRTVQWMVDGFESLQSEPIGAGVKGAARARRVDECHLKLLKESLRTALAIEFMTIPPYLCALWSIKDDVHPVANSIREVVQEEMLHMVLVCNMLAGLGEHPAIANCVAEYPTELPGGVQPGLEIGLSGLSSKSLKTFMRIEQPEHIVPHGHDHNHDEQDVSGATIGQFYVQIERAFEILDPQLSTDCQLAGSPVAAVCVPTSLDDCIVANTSDVKKAINVIRDQGEGSSKTPEDSGQDDLAHYYRFEELFVRRKLERDSTTGRYFHGEPIKFPDVWPMGRVPAGGYKGEDLSGNVLCLLEQFDRTYSSMLDFLDDSWRPGGQGAFVRSLDLMFELEKYARPLMQIPIIYGESETFGPCFRYRRHDRDGHVENASK